MPFYIAIVKTKGEFINVVAKMLFTGVMIDTVQPTFHYRPYTFNAISCHASADVFASAVVGFVVEKYTADPPVAAMFIRVQHRTDFDILMDGLAQGVAVGIGNWLGNGAAPALTHAEYGSLTDCAAPGPELF